MPYFRDPNLNKDEDQTNLQLSSATQQASDDGSTSAGGDPNKPTGSGSKFTNIDSYLQGGNAKGFGEEFGGKIQSGINEAKSGIDTAAGNVLNQIKNTGYAPTQEEINSYISKAGDSTTDEDAKKYQGWTNQSYTGPKSIADSGDAWNQYWNKANQATTEAKQSGTEAGRFALLDKYYGRPNYSFGQKSLDNLLVQGGGGFNNAADLQSQAAQLGSYGNQKANEVSSLAAQRAGEIERSKEAAKSAIGGAMSGLQSAIDKKVSDTNKQRSSQYSALLEDINSGNITDQDMSALGGISNKSNIYDLDLKNYLHKGNDVNKTNAASDQDYAQYLALSKLAGVDPTYLTASQRAEAGKFQPISTFDTNNFNTDVAGHKVQMENEYNQKVEAPFGGSFNMEDAKSALNYDRGLFNSEEEFRNWMNSASPNDWRAQQARYFYDKINNFNKKYRQGDYSLRGGGSSTKNDREGAYVPKTKFGNI